MSLNAAAIQLLVDKGLSAQDIADLFAACERKKDNTSAERQARYRERRKDGKSRRNSNAVTPPIDNNHTPSVISSNEETTPSAAPQRSAFVKPEWCEDDQDWQDFLTNRKRKRLPNTASAYKGFLDDIARIADDEWPPGRLLKHAAAKGWGGIYDPREQGKPANVRTAPSNRNTAELALAKLGMAGG